MYRYSLSSITAISYISCVFCVVAFIFNRIQWIKNNENCRLDGVFHTNYRK